MGYWGNERAEVHGVKAEGSQREESAMGSPIQGGETEDSTKMYFVRECQH